MSHERAVSGLIPTTSQRWTTSAAEFDGGGADLDTEAMKSCRVATDQLANFFASYTRTDEYSTFQMWLDAWAEASRRPALGATSRRLNIAWQRLIATAIAEGIEEGTLSCDDPDGTAWRVLSLLDGLSMQLAAHPGLIERNQVLDWAMTALEREVGLAARSLARPASH